MTDHAAPLAAERADAVAMLAQLTGDHSAMIAAARDDNADDEHDPEGSTIAFERAQLSSIIADVRQRLADLDQAELRLAEGSYGVCEVCGSEIAPQRLAARPAARRCVRCA